MPYDSGRAAALLHDIGHFVDALHDDDCDDAHELRAIPFLASGFDDQVLAPVRRHVQAKRYLVVTDARYAVSDKSRRTPH